MEYNFVTKPSVDTLTDKALNHRSQIDSANKAKESNMPYFIMSGDDSSREPLTSDEIKLLQQHDQKMAEFTRDYYFFEEVVTDAQRISYIVGHRGGDEFPSFKGSVNYEELASGVLSQLRLGTYSRGSGAAYSLAEFESNVTAAYEKELKSGWLRKT